MIYLCVCIFVLVYGCSYHVLNVLMCFCLLHAFSLLIPVFGFKFLTRSRCCTFGRKAWFSGMETAGVLPFWMFLAFRHSISVCSFLLFVICHNSTNLIPLEVEAKYLQGSTVWFRAPSKSPCEAQLESRLARLEEACDDKGGRLLGSTMIYGRRSPLWTLPQVGNFQL